MSTTMTSINDNIVDWIILNNGFIVDRATAYVIYDTPEIDRTTLQKQQWFDMNNRVLNLAENGPRPNAPYISVHMEMVQRPLLTPYRSKPVEILDIHGDPTGEANVTVYYIEAIHVYLQSYGKGSNNNLQLLQQSLMISDVLERMRKVGLVFLYDSGIQDIHILVDETYEDRFAYDLVFSIGQTITDKMGLIKTVGITDTINPPQ